ncbi:MAG TPA: hypothetical protein VFX70_20255 [Mycobacteriales bacterium]|nr:hypothetical protein [Mycobacteriales bacterium]
MITPAPAPSRGCHVFADETKERDYLLVAGAILAGDLTAIRSTMRGLVLKGQHRVHMKKESDSRKRSIAAAICDTNVKVTVYNAGRGRRDELDARAACLRALVCDAAAACALMLVLEQDDSLRRWDNQRLVEISREVGCRDTLCYQHRRAATEHLLVIPDAVAWCWAKGGDWRRRIEPVVTAARCV